jgi:hypothetical protein
VGHEALRLRMVAMHGREDPLLDAARFPRLLRQANDAEVADVRKVGDDDYEISSQRLPARPLPQLSAPREERVPSTVSEGEVAAAPDMTSSGNRENGQRLGVRFRRGSRGPLRAGEIPLIGVVQVEPPEPVASEAAPEPVVEAKRPRTRRPPRKRAAAVPVATDPDGTPEGGESAPPKRPRTRSRKKAE